MDACKQDDGLKNCHDMFWKFWFSLLLMLCLLVFFILLSSFLICVLSLSVTYFLHFTHYRFILHDSSRLLVCATMSNRKSSCTLLHSRWCEKRDSSKSFLFSVADIQGRSTANPVLSSWHRISMFWYHCWELMMSVGSNSSLLLVVKI
jgi:hypothetical protein